MGAANAADWFGLGQICRGRIKPRDPTLPLEKWFANSRGANSGNFSPKELEKP
jgi:hypothetical protein